MKRALHYTLAGLLVGGASLNFLCGSSALAASWPQRQRDSQNTGRADFTVPANRQGANFFAAVRWQKQTPNSPNQGNLSASSMVFFDGVGPDGADLVVSGYHWPKGVQAMERHTGQLLWNGNPDGGESIGENTPAFSPDGQTVYVINDATKHPLMAFAADSGPSSYWHNGADPGWKKLSSFSPKVAPDGRIFASQWDDRPSAGTDSGSAITVTWDAATRLCTCYSRVAIHPAGSKIHVLATGRCGWLGDFDGDTGAELWRVDFGGLTDGDPTVDPVTGRIYLPVGDDSIRIVGVDLQGAPLWSQLAMPVHTYTAGVNHRERAQSSGCLAHDGQTYYFQTVNPDGLGQLYAIHTADGTVKWAYPTGSKGWEYTISAPIVTPNGVLVVGNNQGGVYFALRDDGTNATLLDTLEVAAGGTAFSSATLSPDGLLYLPARLPWTQGNGDGETPTFQVQNLFNAFDLNAVPDIPLPSPAGQTGRALNAAVQLRWQAVSDPAGFFSHYAIYRANVPFTSLDGLTPVMTIPDRLTTNYLDAPLVNGQVYYYFIASIPTAGTGPTTVQAIGGYRPVDETDLQVVSISRTPRFPRYAAEYTTYQITEPSGFGPYIFSAATGLGQGQTPDMPRWPATNDPVTYTATIRNRGGNPWAGAVTGVWQWDGVPVQTNTHAGPLAPDGILTFTLVRPWDGAMHEICFSLPGADARPANNTVTIYSKSVGFLSFVDQSYYDSFTLQSTNYPDAATDDLIDWIQRHMARFNAMFAAAGSTKRVHYDWLELLPDSAPDPAVNNIEFAIFPFRFYAWEVPYSYRSSSYYRSEEDIDYGYLHEMGHQLGLIDLYRMDLSPGQNQVSGLGYTAPDCLMRGCSPFLSTHSALAMSLWQDQAHGYYGQYLYRIPAEVRMRFVSRAGQPLSDATVKVYQLEERPGVGHLLTPQIKAQGVTDQNGIFVLPNVPVDPDKVPPLPTGDVLHANPFGYVAVIGVNGLLHFRVEYEGMVDYAWLDITEPNVAYYQGQTNQATFERELNLGGPLQRFPPVELTETNAVDWVAWAEGGAAGATTATDDAAHKQVGQTSLKFVTDGGADTYVRYPGAFKAQWDLTGVQTLKVRFFAQNPNLGFQEGSPWIRLWDQEGNYFQYQYYIDGSPADILNDALEQWCAYSIPLDVAPTTITGWRRTAFGAPDLSRIAALEIHADTWGTGFTLWIDGVSFAPTPAPTMSTTPAPGGLNLCWPATHPVPVLEMADSVTGPYLPLPVTPVVAGGVASVTLPMTNGERYFRLRMP